VCCCAQATSVTAGKRSKYRRDPVKLVTNYVLAPANLKEGQQPLENVRRFRFDVQNGWPPFSTVARSLAVKRGINFVWHEQTKTFQMIVNSRQEYEAAMCMVYQVRLVLCCEFGDW